MEGGAPAHRRLAALSAAINGRRQSSSSCSSSSSGPTQVGASAADQQAEQQQQQQQLMDHLYTFENQGFVTIPNVLSATETAALRARIEAPGRLPPLRRDHPTSFFGLNQGQADQEGAGILDWVHEASCRFWRPRSMRRAWARTRRWLRSTAARRRC